MKTEAKPLNEISAMRKAMKYDDTDNRKFEAIWSAARDIETLYEQAESIKNKMEQVMWYCRTAGKSANIDAFYLGVNSLGELQFQGVQFDIQCALASRSVDELNKSVKEAK